jgi:DNA sulfur modification protein DndE
MQEEQKPGGVVAESAPSVVPASREVFGKGKVYLGGEVCKWLSILKGRLQMDEGSISRLALCYSLGERYAPDPSLIDQESGKEFLLQQLTGPSHIGQLSFALLWQRMFDDGLDPHDPLAVEQQFVAHLSRGMLALGVRVKNLADIGRLIEEAQERFRKSQAAGTDEIEVALDAQAGQDIIMGPAESTSEKELDAGTTGYVTPTQQPERVDSVPVEGDTGAPVSPERLPRPIDVRTAVTLQASSLWGALLPAPVAAEGQVTRVRRKRKRRYSG